MFSFVMDDDASAVRMARAPGAQKAQHRMWSSVRPQPGDTRACARCAQPSSPMPFAARSNARSPQDADTASAGPSASQIQAPRPESSTLFNIYLFIYLFELSTLRKKYSPG